MIATDLGRTFALHLRPPPDRASEHVPDREPEESPLDAVVERARALEVPIRPLSFVSVNPAADIIQVARAKAADLILLGLHKPLLGGARLGGTVHTVMECAEKPVVMFLDRGLALVRRVLLPFAGGEHDRAALELAARIQATTRAEVTLLHVVDPERGRRLDARSQSETAFREGHGDVRFKVVESETPEHAALAEAAGGYDLVVVGAGEEWGLESRRFGLGAELLLQASPVSVAVVVGGRGGIEGAIGRPAVAPAAGAGG